MITPSRTFELKASADDGKDGKVCVIRVISFRHFLFHPEFYYIFLIISFLFPQNEWMAAILGGIIKPISPVHVIWNEASSAALAHSTGSSFLSALHLFILLFYPFNFLHSSFFIYFISVSTNGLTMSLLLVRTMSMCSTNWYLFCFFPSLCFATSNFFGDFVFLQSFKRLNRIHIHVDGQKVSIVAMVHYFVFFSLCCIMLSLVKTES